MPFIKSEDPRNQVIQIRMTAAEKDELQNVSEATGENLSDLVREALNEYYKNFFPQNV